MTGGVTVGSWSADPRRMLALLARHPAAVRAVFAPAEAAALLAGDLDPLDCAVRWAVKEATLRALGVPPRLRGRWADVLVDTGGPVVRLRGAVADHARATGVRRLDATVRRRGDRLVATVVRGGAGRPPAPPQPRPGPPERTGSPAPGRGVTALRGGTR